LPSPSAPPEPNRAFPFGVLELLAKLGVPVTCTDIFGVWGSTWLDGLALGQP